MVNLSSRPTPTRPRGERPQVIPWGAWYAHRARLPGQGRHILFDGPTQSGKTLLARYMARLRDFVVVLGTKPVDPSLDAYVDEGYTRIDHWPPTPGDFRRGGWSADEARFILWPRITKREQLRAYAHVYAACLDDIFIQGRWTIVCDEGLWLSSRSGLNLGQQLGDIAYGGASNKVSLYLCIQRPAGIPRITWQSCADAFIFKTGVTNDLRELASLGTYDPKPVAEAIKHLGRFQFLDLPCRGGAIWSVSRVEMGRGSA
jgi:hypothetical protein